MKRDNRFNYGHAVRQQDIEFNEVKVDVKPNDKFGSHSPSDTFLSIVYAKDERTKLPIGDLKYLVSDNANPEVKEWVLKNIMLDTSSAVSPSAPKGLSDDDIAALARSPQETVHDYMERVNDFMRNNIEVRDRLLSEFKRNVQSQSDGSPVPSE